MTPTRYDIAIIGGGPIGAALALALPSKGLRICVLANNEPQNKALRPIALSHGSQLLLERLGLWHALSPQTTKILNIHISEKHALAAVTIKAQELQLPALGYVLDYSLLSQCLSQSAQKAHPDFRLGCKVLSLAPHEGGATVHYLEENQAQSLNCRLVIVADGGALINDNPTQHVDYQQCALTARIGCDHPQPQKAFERFCQEGPVALLPFGEDLALVGTVSQERAEMLMRAEPPIFLQWVQSCFGSRLGKFTHLADRATFPLTLHYQKPDYAHLSKTPIIRIGNAAQRLHPVAGQGLNLGLRDAWALARFIQTTEPEALGSAVTRHQFEKIRHSDRTASIAFTHGLVRLFSNDWPILTQARRGALFTLACFSPARNWLAQRMMHGVYG